jgi:hypothetical protein
MFDSELTSGDLEAQTASTSFDDDLDALERSLSGDFDDEAQGDDSEGGSGDGTARSFWADLESDSRMAGVASPKGSHEGGHHATHDNSLRHLDSSFYHDDYTKLMQEAKGEVTEGDGDEDDMAFEAEAAAMAAAVAAGSPGSIVGAVSIADTTFDGEAQSMDAGALGGADAALSGKGTFSSSPKLKVKAEQPTLGLGLAVGADAAFDAEVERAFDAEIS